MKPGTVDGLVYKPGFVPLWWSGDGHLSGLTVAREVEQPTRRLVRVGPTLSSCLALLPVGFAEPTGHPAAGALLH